MSGKEPVVSVLMICYNQERFVGQAIRSVLRQRTSFPVELVICDDSSTDGTSAICAGYAERYPDRIRYYRNAVNRGVAPNFIQAYDYCRGRYIAICEGDDYWLSKRKLARQVALLEAHPECVICHHRVLNYYEADGSMSLTARQRPAVTTLADLARCNTISNVSALFRRVEAELPAWMSETFACDYVLHFLNAVHGSILYTPRVMAVYRKHAQSVWSLASRERQLLISLKSRELLLAHFAGNPDVEPLLQEKYGRIATDLATLYETAGERETAAAFRQRAASALPGWSPERYPGEEPALRAASGRSVFRALSAVRRRVTRWLPRPGRGI